jgi:hypothetical protein
MHNPLTCLFLCFCSRFCTGDQSGHPVRQWLALRLVAHLQAHHTPEETYTVRMVDDHLEESPHVKTVT